MTVNSSLRIRPATADDSAVLMTWRNDPSAYRWYRTDRPVTDEEHASWVAARLAAPNPDLWVADLAGQPAGSVNLSASGEISVVVDPAARGHGVGRALVEHASAAAARDGMPNVTAVVHRDNAASIRLFESVGFTRVPTERGHWLRYVRSASPYLAPDER